MYPRLFQAGPLMIPTLGAMAAVGLVCGLLLAMRVARELRVNPDEVWNLGLLAVCSAFAGSRLLLVAFNWSDFLHFPLLMLLAAPAGSGAVFYGGLAFAVATAYGYARWKRMPMLRTLDALAPAAALAHGIYMLGAFAGGCSYGEPTAQAWGVVFRDKFAAMWCGAPLGVPLQPTQLYESAAELLICVFLLWLLVRRAARQAAAQDGEILGAWLFLFGAARFVVEFYRADPGRGSLFNGLMTVTQGIALLAVLEGGFLWMDRSQDRNTVAHAVQ